MGSVCGWVLAAGLLAVGVCSTVGCASLQSASSGQIGCAEKDIVIKDDQMGWNTRTWTAECHGKRFYCSAVQTGKEQSQISCKEEPAAAAVASAPQPQPTVPAAPTPPPAEGCKFDTQCKGDRVCQKGECVDPVKTPVDPAPPVAP